MEPKPIPRREALSWMATAGAATSLLLHARTAHAEPATAKPKAPPAAPQASAGKRSPVPLPFDPKKLRGLSEKLIVSHHDNNYAGAVKNLGAVEEQLRSVTKDTPGFLVAALKERELSFANSVTLHELYFANLGGDGKAAGAIQAALGEGAGGFARFEETFRAAAMGLAGGSGWAVLDLDFHSGELRTYAAANHTQALAFAQPLLVLDMYEHAFHIDYGAAAARYVDAFFANLRWDEVNRRYERALGARKALTS